MIYNKNSVEIMELIKQAARLLRRVMCRFIIYANTINCKNFN